MWKRILLMGNTDPYSDMCVCEETHIPVTLVTRRDSQSYRSGTIPYNPNQLAIDGLIRIRLWFGVSIRLHWEGYMVQR